MIENLIHIVPFDIGNSFTDYETNKKQNKKDFLELLDLKCKKENIIIDTNCSDKYMCVAEIDKNVKCYILEYGVGVFVIKNLNLADTKKADIYFKKFFSCKLYFKKKQEQNIILNKNGLIGESINKFLQLVWDSVKVKIRPYSASSNYKHGGLSYVLTIYHIYNIENSKDINDEMDILMNPNLLSSIQKEDQWEKIIDKVYKHKSNGYKYIEYNEISKVISSWSAVAVIDEEKSSLINNVIDYEILLQSSWFFFDCLMDNIKRHNMSNVELQKEKSLMTNVLLEIDNIASANMSTNDKNIIEEIYNTSGFVIIKNKLSLLLENRIAIAEAKVSEKQGIYSIITEILLVLFTLISIYDTVKNIICGELKHADFIVILIMTIVFVISSVLIVKKEK